MSERLPSSFREAALRQLRAPFPLGRIRATSEEFHSFLDALRWPAEPTADSMQQLRDAQYAAITARPARERLGLLNAHAQLKRELDVRLCALLDAAGLMTPPKRPGGSKIRPGWARPLLDFAVLAGQETYEQAASDLDAAKTLAESPACRAVAESLLTFEDLFVFGDEVSDVELLQLADELAVSWPGPESAPVRFVRDPRRGVGVATSDGPLASDPLVLQFRDGEARFERVADLWSAVLEWLFEVRPFIGAGPLQFGMSRAAVRDAFAEPCAPVDETREYFRGHGVFVDFAADGRCEFIEFGGPVQPHLGGRRLLGLRHAEARALVAARDPALIEDADGLRSLALGLTLYSPGHEKHDARVEGVGAFVRGYFDGQ